MTELNLKQIVDKLNTEFVGEHRKFAVCRTRTNSFTGL